jgi:DNA-binding CsgD family transcriptional regulator
MMMPLGLSDTLIFRFNSGSRSLIFIAINSATWGFSPRDKMVAELLCSHFAVAYDNAIAFTEAEALKLLADNSAAIGTLVVDPLGQLHHSNETALRLMGKHFNRTCWDSTQPDPIQTWLGTDASIGLPMSTLEEVQGATRLMIRWSDRSNGVKILLLQEQVVPTAGETSSSGLTRREAEVLHWIGEGKRNTEIARILQISERTVEKHAEKIYVKLGVENRMGAALQVLSQSKIRMAGGRS